MAGEPLLTFAPVHGVAAGIRGGDVHAFEEFFREEYAGLCSFLVRQVGDAAEAEELAQDVLLRLWRARDRLRADVSPRAYLYRAARNAAINHRRRAARERAHVECGLVDVPRPRPSDELLRVRELRDATASAIAELPARCRLIFEMSRHDHLSHREIAHALDLSPRTVETQIARALKLLRNRLAPLLD